MSDTDDTGDFFAPPAFKPDAALQDLRRRLRELRQLTERQSAAGLTLELKGSSVIELKVEAGLIAAKLAKRPARTPEWEGRSLKSGAEVRSFFDEVKRRLVRWEDE